MSVSYTHLDVYKRQVERFNRTLEQHLSKFVESLTDWDQCIVIANDV